MTTTSTPDLADAVRRALNAEPDCDTVLLHKDAVRALLDPVNTDAAALAAKMTLGRIGRTFAVMPFGGLAGFAYPQRAVDVLTLDEVAANLERLREVLDNVAAEHDAEREELGRYRRLATALRDVAALVTGEGAS